MRIQSFLLHNIIIQLLSTDTFMYRCSDRYLDDTFQSVQIQIQIQTH